ncbi:phage tail sheath family protein, partial [Streptomyces platensis]|nr:phage tail sheath family protein [Streptomyces platensis]
MPSYLSPGVYVEEVASGSRPIEGVGTSVAAFVGLAPTGPLNEPTLVTNWSQYVAAFGEFTDGYYLAHSVYGFFNNGGTAAYVVRVGGTDDGAQQAAAPEAPKALTAGEPSALGAFKVAAIAAGSANGGALTVEVQDVEGEGGADRFKLVVKDGDKVVESFDVSAKKSARNYVVAQVKQRSKTIAVEEAVPAGQ